MLNSAPLNTWPLNALGGAGGSDPVDPEDPPVEPIVVPPGHAFRWAATVMMGGIDVTSRLTGALRVDREAAAAGIAEFQLFYPAGTDVVTDMADRAITIDYLSDDGQTAIQTRVFTGFIAEPSWDAPSRVMRIIATDNLQQKVEAKTVEEIDTLAAGVWSADIFGPVSGRSHWDYAQERMSSRQASLDCDADGALRVTSWISKPAPDYIFAPGTTVYGSINVQLAQSRNVTNRVEVDFSYRYARLHEARIKYSWKHSGAGGGSGVQGFCNWRSATTVLPDRGMIYSATESASLTPIAATWYDLPPSMTNPCFDGSPWINRQEGLLLGAEWTAARRWVQPVTEKYNLVLATAAGMTEDQQVISRTSYSISIDSEYEGVWSNSLTSVNPDAEKQAIPVDIPAGDQADESRRSLALKCALQVAKTAIIDGHRQTKVSWSVPASMAIGIDLGETVKLDDHDAKSVGVLTQRVDELSFESGSAMTILTISVVRMGGESEDLVVPPRLGADDPIGGGQDWGGTVSLQTQIGRSWSSEYDDEMDGFAGNASVYTGETFPRRMTITAPELSDSLTDEVVHQSSSLYEIGINSDLLEI